MRILLDTHILLWSLFESKKIKKYEREALIDPQNEILVSSISLWEISLKFSIGKLELHNILPEDILAIVQKTGFSIINMEAQEACSYHQLPKFAHKDPFDRMLIWQAICQNFYFMTHDKACEEYKKKGLKIFTAQGAHKVF
ncbi:FIG00768848: hypothetical protein [hydrothermal vent metagenome]|uniref:PIN domain-containing protein n=1 Tax=hydrothermal vent metagenome TaxID=652676 RepID=A0A3B1DLV7_9ZZZZ